MQADFVPVGDTRVLVRRWGNDGAPSVFYWHGGGGGSDEWPRIAPALEAAGYAVYAPEAPGFGQSPPLDPEQHLASSLAGVAGALIDELGIAPVVWIGFSWGASIGLHTAVRNPDWVRALVLLDGGYLMPEDDPSDDPALDFEAGRDAWRIELERQEDEDEAPIEIVAAAMAGSNVEPPPPLLPRIAEAAIPLLLVAATAPAQWNEVRARRIDQLRATVPTADVVRVQAGHGILQEAGDEVRRVVLAWLRGLE